MPKREDSIGSLATCGQKKRRSSTLPIDCERNSQLVSFKIYASGPHILHSVTNVVFDVIEQKLTADPPFSLMPGAVDLDAEVLAIGLITSGDSRCR